MGLKKRLTGYTERTMENRQMGAGAYFKNYDVETDTFTTAVTSGKLLGATQGGGSFTAKPIITTTEVDGVPSDAKGMEDIDGWEVSMSANILEITAENIKIALGAATIETTTDGKYKKITGKSNIDPADYQDNITFLGTMSGFDEPIILQIYNALAMEGINVNPQDKKTTLLPTKFKAHSSFENLDEAPFAIFVPVKAGSESGSGE